MKNSPFNAYAQEGVLDFCNISAAHRTRSCSNKKVRKVWRYVDWFRYNTTTPATDRNWRKW